MNQPAQPTVMETPVLTTLTSPGGYSMATL
ncbi:hypothetical protein A2U01_0084063, partial [Trifolium medium]|nr:hypothetical protein [Trifolium medium]